ncbi:gamma-glutamylcyclotransferase [Vibrio sp. Of7-15]|uniref:gamma-glutamylcyclotransferase family protein n=1 Tax=Vibrio sp. Of7-15 TaxID=2724879 RepID=UPI001EF18947|nr:gamma-glutamylcyclotransferase family protein [Vibrio sp. Of7-15]MCG7498710.1 gamma-glutamylcyclotransferase [Vibrio sp. Of7-15]
MKQTELVFVYGTLREGESNHGLLESSEYLGSCQTLPQFALFDLGPYPAAILGKTAIVGEVYRVDILTMANLDQLEEYPKLYDRIKTQTPFGSAWIYLYQNSSELRSVIDSNDWKNR